jgi:hypothetical protein
MDKPNLSLVDIELDAKSYSDARQDLLDSVANFRDRLMQLKREELPTIKRKALIVARSKASGMARAESVPELFTKPRTYVFHGIKVGLTTSPGKLEVDDEDLAVKRIEELWPERAASLVKVEKSLIVAPIKRLPADELKLIGAQIEGAGDVLVYQAVDGEIEKLINKMIDEVVEAALEEES